MTRCRTFLLLVGAVAVALTAVFLATPNATMELGFSFSGDSPQAGSSAEAAKASEAKSATEGTDAAGYGFCCCSADEVDSNTKELLSTLNEITTHPYFRYFKVNSGKDCPFWAVSLLCTSEDDACSVGKLTEELIPHALRSKEDMSDVHTPDSHIMQSVPHPKNVDNWGFWSSVDDGSEYVDLVANPEGNTGFSGPLAIKVWQAIYRENCLSAADETCKEVDVLRTLLSGMHMNINMQVCTNFRKDPELKSPQHSAGIYNNPDISFYPNCDMFMNRVAPNRQFIDNLYVLYQFTLRALTKSKDLFVGNLDSFNSGDDGAETAGDAVLKKSITELFNSKLLCVKTFDETKFLESPKGRDLIPQMNSMMSNVTHLMDCVPCEKCRIWGKVETKGIATALKVNMRDDKDAPLELDRAEKVALVNLARQMAFSVRNVRRLAEYCPTEGAAADKVTHSHG